jgi:hypothetical protein
VLKQIQVKPVPGQGQGQQPTFGKSGEKMKQEQSVDPQVKNSYIYNKYFKDYAQPGAPTVPLTPEQRKQQAIKDYLVRVAAQKRIEQSRKLLFNTSNIQVAPNNGNLNKLFRFNR